MYKKREWYYGGENSYSYVLYELLSATYAAFLHDAGKMLKSYCANTTAGSESTV